MNCHACLSSSGGGGGDSTMSYNSSSSLSSHKSPSCTVLERRRVHMTLAKLVKENGGPLRRVVLMYQVQYHYAMEDLQTQLSERGDVLVVMGQVPEHSLQQYDNKVPSNPIQDGCGRNSCGCVNGSNSIPTNENEDFSKDVVNGDSPDDHTNTTTEPSSSSASSCMILGGLELPGQLDWSSYTLIFIGDVLDDDDD